MLYFKKKKKKHLFVGRETNVKWIEKPLKYMNYLLVLGGKK